MMLTGKARLAGVIGWPISHSLSPALHGFWIRELGLDAAYVPLAVRPEDFRNVVSILPLMGFRGVNVTLPHKEAAFQLSETRDDAAAATGAVNTLVFEGGRVHGRNTDVTGYLASLDEAGVGVLEGKSAVVLGAGGAARAVIFGLVSRGLGRVCIVNRSLEKAAALASFFGDRVSAQPWGELAQALGSADLLVNTSSLGMAGQPGLDVDVGWLKSGAVVSDIVYRPLETQLLADARSRGLKTVDGLGMLLHQARAGFNAWFDANAHVTPELRRHLLSILEGKS
ncbi:MAG: shikimate dehydrogenase [Micropepsaceae bacterium]